MTHQCNKMVQTKLFGKRRCINKLSHKGYHTPDLKELLDGKVGKRAPDYISPKTGMHYTRWYLTGADGNTRPVHASSILNGKSQGKQSGLSRTPEYHTAINHYLWAHDPKSHAYNSCKDTIFYPEWDTARGQKNAAAVFANNAALWMVKYRAKPKKGEWEFHVGKDANRIKRFDPHYFKWVPKDDIHVRMEKERDLSRYSNEEINQENLMRQCRASRTK